jgi:diguanylate cyclase (GGDEF)-like protein
MQRVRRAQIDAFLRLLPFVCIANVAIAALVAATLYGKVSTPSLLLWLGAITVGSLLRLWMFHGRATEQSGDRLANVLKGVLLVAALWAVPPVFWFGTVGPAEQLIIAVVVTGMLSGGSITLSTVPPAALIYVGVLSCAMFYAEIGIGLSYLAITALAYGVMLCTSTLPFVRQFVSHFRAQEELQEQSQLVQLLRDFDASGSDWLWELDGDFRLTYVSREMVSHLGLRAGDLIGLTIFHLLDPNRRIRSISAGMRSLFEHLEGGLAFRDLVVPTGEGQKWWSLSGKPQLDLAGKCVGWRGVGSDVTVVRQSGTDSLGAARHDPMTGLANRLMIREQLEAAMLQQRGKASACSLLLVDLDRFKLVNDTLGHAVGDQLLCQVAQRLEQVVGDVGRVGRLGGDEFAILLLGAYDDAELADLAEVVIARLSEPFSINGPELSIGATIGIASSPRDGDSQEELTRNADLALYRAKEAGRGSFQFFDAAMVEDARSRRQLETDLRVALRTGGLSLAYQPIVDARVQSVTGFEALLRWHHPERGQIPPDLFVPVIEHVGLIRQVGEWVLREACHQAAGWPEEMQVAVNVSAAQIDGSSLAAAVVNALASSGLAPARLELEITESVFLGDDPTTVEALDRLRSLGVQLVLDDFGTGYSSFGRLAPARFNKVKIDKQFVHGVSNGSLQARAIVEAIVALGHGLGLAVTAEGIETPAQAAMMRAAGCDLLQGFYFGRPIEAAALHFPAIRAPAERKRA